MRLHIASGKYKEFFLLPEQSVLLVLLNESQEQDPCKPRDFAFQVKGIQLPANYEQPWCVMKLLPVNVVSWSSFQMYFIPLMC